MTHPRIPPQKKKSSKWVFYDDTAERPPALPNRMRVFPPPRERAPQPARKQPVVNVSQRGKRRGLSDAINDLLTRSPAHRRR